MVDIDTALRVLSARFDNLAPHLQHLTPEEIASEKQRFEHEQTEVMDRVTSGMLATKAPRSPTFGPTLLKLQILTKMRQPPDVLDWGAGVLGLHGVDNSYLGFQVSEKQAVGTANRDKGPFLPPPVPLH
jgi:hypothetical protein